MLYKYLGILLAVVFISAPVSAAQQAPITQDMVTQKYNTLATLLSNRGAIKKAIRFMHNHIGENARFNVTVNNPLIQGNAMDQAMTLDKVRYINSYIQGTNFIDNYEMDIQTIEFVYDPSSQAAYSKEIITERGLARDPMSLYQDNGRAFVSRTVCSTRHEMKQGFVVSTGSQCHTDVSYEEAI